MRLRRRDCQSESKLRSRLFFTRVGACILLLSLEAASCHLLMQMICLPRGRWQLRGWALVWPQGQKPLPEGQVPRRKAFRARHNLGVHLNVCHLERKKCPSFGAAFSLWGVGHRRRKRGLLQMVFGIHDYKKVETGNTFFGLQQQRKIKWNFSSSLWSVMRPAADAAPRKAAAQSAATMFIFVLPQHILANQQPRSYLSFP